jgi:hypothetical protein
MNNNFRNTELLQKLERHPLKAALARALDASELFAGDIEHIKLDRRLSPEGRDDARRSKLGAAVRDNRDARGPVNDLQKKLEAKRALVQHPPLDQSQAARDDRREARLILRGIEDKGARALLLSGAGADPDFQDAMLERKPIFSGLMAEEQFLVDAAKEQRLAGLYPSELAEIAELETTIAEANGIFDLALVDLKLHSEMDDRSFTEFVTPIMNRRNAHWLKRDKDAHGNEVIYVFDPKNHYTVKVATPDEQRDGVFFKDLAEYQASRAA